MIIPTLSDGTAFYTQRTNLDGTDFQLDFRWATREARWYVRLLDTLGNVLVGPMKLVVNWPLMRYYARPARRARGRALVHDPRRVQRPAGDFRTRRGPSMYAGIRAVWHRNCIGK